MSRRIDHFGAGNVSICDLCFEAVCEFICMCASIMSLHVILKVIGSFNVPHMTHTHTQAERNEGLDLSV